MVTLPVEVSPPTRPAVAPESGHVSQVSQLRSNNAKQISDEETRGITLLVEVSPLTRPAVAPDMCLLRIDPLARLS